MEECIQEQNDVVFDGDAIEQHRLRLSIERIGHECWLDHDQRIVDVFFIKYVTMSMIKEDLNLPTIQIKRQRLTDRKRSHRDCY